MRDRDAYPKWEEMIEHWHGDSFGLPNVHAKLEVRDLYANKPCPCCMTHSCLRWRGWVKENNG